MRGSLILALVFGVSAFAVTATAAAASPSSGKLVRGGLYGGRGYFAVACRFSHRNHDDPIVFPGHRGRSHDHTYFGNTSTDAFSTPASLRNAGQTTCLPPEDTTACLGDRLADLRLTVRFPDCWDGKHLDSVDHKRHMAYSSAGRCPLAHPIELPAISLVIYYGVPGDRDAELASGGQFSGHADFINAWNQRTLAALVDRYLNAPGYPGPKG
jgi:Domain of unknown function (DUF1996)